MSRRALLAFGATAFLALPAAPAVASTAEINPVFGELRIDVSEDIAHDVTVSLANGTFTVTDTAGITPSDATCTASGPNAVTCVDTGVGEVLATFGNQADRFTSTAPVVSSVSGGDGNDILVGGPQRDSLRGDAGDDQVAGAGGRDNLDGDVGNDILTGGPGRDSLDGGLGNDLVFGEAGDDSLQGRQGMDGLDGGNDDDELDGGTGADALAGGLGTRDELIYSDRVAPVRASLLPGAGNGEAGENDTVVAADFENLSGSESDDNLTGNAEQNSISGGDGNDTIDGGAGNDDLDGGPGNNVVSGGTGNDFLDADRGADVFNGGPGRDFTSYSDRRTRVVVTANDRPGDGEAREGDNVKRDVEGFSGGSADDRLIGSNGPNSIDGNEGKDTILGLGGHDLLFGDDDNDVVSGGDGADYLDGGAEADILSGGRQRDTFYGGEQNDTINSRSAEPDQVSCLTGFDRVNADFRDRIDADCESVRRRV
jgi:Ca2+-binding RTX toxin-like protein